MTKVKANDSKSSKVGGLAFFLSMLSMLPLFVGSVIFIGLNFETASLLDIGPYLAGVVIGALCAHYLLRGHLSVFIHELKHSLFSNAVGNKWKGMKVGKETGHFEYAYYKQTGHFNALIYLSPYCLPLATLLLALVSVPISILNPKIAVAICGIGYGIDIVCNLRDIGPWQTDLTSIRGGFPVALAYIAVYNLAFLALIIIWLLFGWQGFATLFYQCLDLAYWFAVSRKEQGD